MVPQELLTTTMTMTTTSEPQNFYKKKKVLEEDDYVNGMATIIERDFFPDSEKLKSHLDLLDSAERRNIAMNKIWNQIIQEQNNFGATPLRNEEFYDDKVSAVDDNNEKLDLSYVTLDQFTRRYTSEDNESFEEIQKKDMEERKRKFHWMYEPIGGREAGKLMLYHIGEKLLTLEDRKKMDSILDRTDKKHSEYYEDSRPNGPELWNFRVQNQLMFPIDLEVSRQICGLQSSTHIYDTLLKIENNQPSSAIKLIENPKGSTGVNESASIIPITSILPSSSNDKGTTNVNNSSSRVGLMLPPEKKIIHKNTRFKGSLFKTSLTNNSSNRGTSSSASPTCAISVPIPSPIEYPHTLSSYTGSEFDKLDDSRSSNDGSSHSQAYRYISMTPSPMPDRSSKEGGVTPLMTWGEISGTPLILNTASDVPSYPDELLGTIELSDPSPMASTFNIQPATTREKLAQSLGKNKSTHIAIATPQKNNTSSTPKVATSKLTPAAQALALRLHRQNKGVISGTASSVAAASPFGGLTPSRSILSNGLTSNATPRISSGLKSRSGTSIRSRK